MHKRLAPIFERTKNKIEENKQSMAAECFEENKDSPSDFVECLKQKQDAVREVPDKFDAYTRFGLMKSAICIANWDDSRECIKETKDKLNEAVGGLFATDE